MTSNLPSAGLPIKLERDRVLGRFDGVEHGPLLIALGAMHGNEPAGVLAIERVMEMLHHDRAVKPRFNYRGRFLGLAGNLGAMAQGRRFLRNDLNRHLDPAYVAKLTNRKNLAHEDLEAVELCKAVKAEIASYRPRHVVLVDLHTTTADGGFFSFIDDEPGSRAIALDLHAPVILGMLDGISNTTLHYFNSERLGVPVTALAFEAGSHLEPRSVDRAVSALVNTMRSIGAVHPRDVEDFHSVRLEEDARDLPPLVRLSYTHRIAPEDRFVMRRGYRNFDRVSKGEELADDVNGPVLSPSDGLILMPLYQAQGEDGFFLIEEL